MESKMVDLKKLKEYTQNMRVLYVEDDLTVQTEMAELLKRFFPTVVLADNGQEGLEAYKQENYDLIISDINMPRMNGIEFVTMLKSDQDYRKIPVMIVSYKDRKEDREAGLNAGADYYLTKGSFHDETGLDIDGLDYASNGWRRGNKTNYATNALSNTSGDFIN